MKRPNVIAAVLFALVLSVPVCTPAVAQPHSDGYNDTRPFLSGVALASARAKIGTNCRRPASGGMMVPGTTKPSFDPPGALPVTFDGGAIITGAMYGVRFAFLVSTPAATPAACLITDTVALPAPSVANAFLECSMSSASTFGFGMRHGASGPPLAYWSVTRAKHPTFVREAIHVLGVSSVRCQEPETGE